MRKRYSLLILLMLIIVVGIVVVNFNTIITSQSESSINSDIEITTKTKILAYFNGGYYNYYNKLINKGKNGQEALNIISKGLGDKLVKEAEELRQKPTNARFMFMADYDNPFEYTEEKIGQKVDIDKLFCDTAKSLDDGSAVTMFVVEEAPEITLNYLKNITAKRGEFSTNYSTSSYNRKYNIALATEKLNGRIIKAHDSMSFNEVVGERTAEKGYKDAGVIYDGELVSGIGGGVCQVSSTFYNAFLLSGLRVISANRHSQIIPYLPASRDAMVTSFSDVIAGNMTDYPIYVVTKATGDDVYIAMYGKKLDYEYKISNKIIKTLPPEPDKITVTGSNVSESIKKALLSNDPEKLKNIAYIEKRTKKARIGIVSEAYLECYKGGVLIDKQLISHDTYYPKRGEIIRTVI